MKTLYRKLTRKRRLTRNLCKTVIFLNKTSLTNGVCYVLDELYSVGNIRYWEHDELLDYIKQNKPKDAQNGMSYWWAQDLKGREKRIEFLMNLISEL